MIDILGTDGNTYHLTIAYIKYVVDTVAGCDVHLTEGDIVSSSETRVSFVTRIQTLTGL